MPSFKPPRIHPTAIVEEDVSLGQGTSVWDHVHIRRGATLGEQCIVGGKAYIAYDVRIGNRVKINSMVYVCYGVNLHDGVMVSAGTVFTNDVFPRATTPDLQQLRSSDPDEATRETIVAEGATIGAGCLIGSDLRIGRFAMVGMGTVVTRDVPDFHLVVGNPARSIGSVCRCGQPVMKWPAGQPPANGAAECAACRRQYHAAGGVVIETTVNGEIHA